MLRQKKDLKIVLLFSQYSSKEGEYLREEFERDNVKVEFVPNVRESGLKKLFMIISRNLVFSPTTKLYAKYGTSKVAKKGALMNLFLNILYSPLSKVKILKKIVRFIEVYGFSDRDYGKYFDIYKPNIVFSTALLSNFDLAFLKNARKRGIPTISMPKSWDNLDKILFRFEPDVFLVQNNLMKKDAVRYQGFEESKIKVVGFLQFDIYKSVKDEESREDYCKRHAFDKNLPIIFIGSEGLWSPNDQLLFEDIIKLREKGLVPNLNLIIRPHFSERYDGRYDYLKKYDRVFIDNSYRITNFFADHWDPTHEDMKDFANTLRHCDISMNFASTLSLDVVCFDKPIINIAYGIRFEGKNDITPIIYQTGFYQEVIRTKATEVVYNLDELRVAVNVFLNDPSYRREGRLELRNHLCYNLDGQSGKRLFEEVDFYLNRGDNSMSNMSDKKN